MASAAGCSRPKMPDPVGAVAVLDGGGDLAFHPDRVGDDEHQHREDAENLHRAEQHELPRVGSKPIYDRLNHRLNPDRHARIAEARPGQSIERGNLGRHLVEQAFDAHKAILA